VLGVKRAFWLLSFHDDFRDDDGILGDLEVEQTCQNQSCSFYSPPAPLQLENSAPGKANRSPVLITASSLSPIESSASTNAIRMQGVPSAKPATISIQEDK
jgi:hypothetical protein